MNYALLHHYAFYCMFVCLAIALFVTIERFIYFVYTLRHTRDIEKIISGDGLGLDAVIEHIGDKGNVPAQALRDLAKQRSMAKSSEKMEHLSQALFIAVRSKLQKNLWMLDTIVTAAPLLGLLGTILGIIETFTSLASSGISDPKGVSAGIGTALFATALGISIALLGLVSLNHLHDSLERITDHLKIMILRIAVYDEA